jgi:hypothetical protein
VSSAYVSDNYHRWVWFHCLCQGDFSCEPWFYTKWISWAIIGLHCVTNTEWLGYW